jgi:regulator of nonsense transcripts 3
MPEFFCLDLPGSMRKTVLSRAYLNFADPAYVYEFKSKFDGHAFITTKGSQYRCSVEYAPFQKVPNPPKKRNPLEGTLEQGEFEITTTSFKVV